MPELAAGRGLDLDQYRRCRRQCQPDGDRLSKPGARASKCALKAADRALFSHARACPEHLASVDRAADPRHKAEYDVEERARLPANRGEEAEKICLQSSSGTNSTPLTIFLRVLPIVMVSGAATAN
ncbi:hypothetical protein RHECNPAF_730091 [Rhizobium etli CNPAF512]|nr:hypothetical protein RHECNPAF_730091 [Rhizobium etli CNPAF512]